MLSVGRMFDEGNRVLFEHSGGYAQSLATGEEECFKREGWVYPARDSVDMQASIRVNPVEIRGGGGPAEGAEPGARETGSDMDIDMEYREGSPGSEAEARQAGHASR